MQVGNIGNVVRWYEYYAEGDIVKDTGLGIVVKKKFPESTESVEIYDVLKSSGSICTFSSYNLDIRYRRVG